MIDWPALTLAQHETTFATLHAVHRAIIDRVDPGTPEAGVMLALAVDINKVMHAGNDDLARREAELAGKIT